MTAKIAEKDILATPLSKLRGVGSRTASLFAKMGYTTVGELIELYPYRYEDYKNLKKIAELKNGEAVTIQARIQSIQTRRALKNKKLTITEAILSDNSGSITAIWFNQPYLSSVLARGQTYYFAGSVIWRTRLQLQSPQFEPISGAQTSVGRIVPVYSLPDGIAQKRYRAIIYQLLNSLPKDYDILPNNLKHGLNLLDLPKAWQQIHFPDSWQSLEKARSRLGFDELLILQLQILLRREQLKKTNAPVIPFHQPTIKKFVDSLPFKLTLSQKRAAWEIIQDLNKNKPMNRLLQGDVGSGKTVVAAIATVSAAQSGFQTAILAPTEILAQQHFKTLKKLLEPQGITVALLTGGHKNKNEIYKGLINGSIQVIAGTHALLNDKVKFKNLGLVVVDEQHRFGVHQRHTLIRQKVGHSPHLLTMTATPIPRTLALTLYGDLAISSITELPPGRQKISTLIIPPSQRQKAYALIRKNILAGRQCFVICPLLEDSDVLEIKSAMAEKERLSKEVFPNFSIGLIHGKMKAADKEKVMRQFQNGEYHILVSTSVVEVGIDVPNATVVLIEGAERFGLAQLHQFRGRVGRGEHPSFCLLVPSNANTPERLQAICQYNDGFKLAELDLKFRGMGELTGVRQSGFFETKIADLSDFELIKKSRAEAEKIIQTDPELKKYPQLKNVIQAKQSAIHPE